MKNILFIMPSLTGGGAEKVLLEILSKIDYSSYKVDLCLILKEGAYVNDVPSQVNIIVLYKSLIHQRLDLYASKYFSSYFEKRSIQNKLKNKKYDVIVSFLEGDGIKKHRYVTHLAPKNITWVHTDLYHNHYTKGNFRAGDEQKAYSMMDNIIFVSNYAKATFERRFPDIVAPKTVIYNPVDRDLINNKSLESISFEKKRFLICATGRLVEQKSYDRLLLLAQKLKEENYSVDFIILGDGILKNELLEKAKELDVLDTVHFLGFVKNPYPYIRVSDLFISTSQSEGYSLVLCEALCLSKATVFTKTAGPQELLDNGKYGLLVEHDVGSIFKGVKSLIDDPTLREYYEGQAHERSLMFNVSDMMKKIMELF